ncbi:unnamed protein product [Parajaminaea phylloscopi]
MRRPSHRSSSARAPLPFNDFVTAFSVSHGRPLRAIAAACPPILPQIAFPDSIQLNVRYGTNLKEKSRIEDQYMRLDVKKGGKKAARRAPLSFTAQSGGLWSNCGTDLRSPSQTSSLLSTSSFPSRALGGSNVALHRLLCGGSPKGPRRQGQAVHFRRLLQDTHYAAPPKRLLCPCDQQERADKAEFALDVTYKLQSMDGSVSSKRVYWSPRASEGMDMSVFLEKYTAMKTTYKRHAAASHHP